MNARSAHRSLKHLGIFYGVCHLGIGTCFGFAQLRYALDGVGQVHLQSVGQLVGDGFAQTVAYIERQFLHTCHVLDRVFRGHSAVGDDVRNLVVSVFVLNPFEHFAASVVIEVGIDIRERNTVGVKESFEKQVVLDWVNLGDAQAIGYNRSCRRTTSRAYHYAKFVTCRVDEILHNKEVTGEAHGLHDVQFELHTLVNFVG